MPRFRFRLLAAILPFSLAACMVGPDYRRPAAPVSARFKEAPPGWSLAQPQDGVDRGAWWSIYNDPVLDQLERQVKINNQNVMAYEAAVRQAKAVVGETRAQLFPTVAISGTPGYGGQGNKTAAAVQLEGTVSWELDIWGSIRRAIENAKASQQASEAQLADATLSAQSSLAQAYFELRTVDAQADLLRNTVLAYQKSLDIVRHQASAGFVSPADVVTAETQVSSTQSSLVNTGVQRTQLEHSIAVLVGKPPADLNIAVTNWTTALPPTPNAVPSSVLQRRPDIAAAERTMKAQNALIGEAIAAYYPTISLSALYSVTGNPVQGLFAVGDRAWSAALGASETLYQGGQRSAAITAARAAYDQSVATYRQTVLTAFQQVEDDLAALRILAEQSDVETNTVALANKSVTLEMYDYQAGTVAYTSVITQQVTALSAAESLLQIRQNRFLASAELSVALGGGWRESDLSHP